jgi:hypothetical protein
MVGGPVVSFDTVGVAPNEGAGVGTTDILSIGNGVGTGVGGDVTDSNDGNGVGTGVDSLFKKKGNQI